MTSPTIPTLPKPPAPASTLPAADLLSERDDRSSFANLERENLFDLLRFIAATMVIYSHSFPLLGLQKDPLAAAGGVPLGTLGVSLFFVLSGFLICRSWLNKPSITAYSAARCLRIFPALVFSLLLCVFVVGPLGTAQPLPQYFKSAQTYDFLNNLFLFPIRYDLPGVFLNNPLKAVNGSLWSLPVEFMMYGVILGLGLTKILNRRALLLTVTGALAICDLLWFSQPQFASRVELTVLVGPSINMALFFLIGSCFYSYRTEIRRDWRLAAAAALLWFLSFGTPNLRLVEYLTLPYLFFFIASLPAVSLRHFARYGDFSYGLYVFAFPVQQCFVHFLTHQKLTVLSLFGFSFVVTLLLSMISWHFIESPALRLKKTLLQRIAR